MSRVLASHLAGDPNRLTYVMETRLRPVQNRHISTRSATDARRAQPQERGANERTACEEAGIDVHLAKPLELEVLGRLPAT
jgi:hypothetical protein